MTLYRNTAGKLSADPTKTSWSAELTDPVFISTHLFTVLSAVIFAFAYFHVGPGASTVVTHLRDQVSAISAIAVVLFQVAFYVHHYGVKALEVDLVAIENNPAVLATDISQATAVIKPLVTDAEEIVKGI